MDIHCLFWICESKDKRAKLEPAKLKREFVDIVWQQPQKCTKSN